MQRKKNFSVSDMTSLERTTSDTMGHQGKPKFNENALFGEKVEKNYGKLKLIWHIFRSRQSPDCLTAFKESWTDFRHGEDLYSRLKQWDISFKERHYLTKH